MEYLHTPTCPSQSTTWTGSRKYKVTCAMRDLEHNVTGHALLM